MLGWMCAVTLAVVAGRDAARERELVQELAKAHPDLEQVFVRATSDSDTDRYAEAAEGFLRVTEGAPEFAPAFRRLGRVQVLLGKFDEAVGSGEKAYALAADADNATLLAMALFLRNGESGLDRRRSSSLVERTLPSVAVGSEEWRPLKALQCQLRFEAQREDGNRCAEEFLANAPESPEANYMALDGAAARGDWGDIEERLEKGREAMPPGEYERLRGQLDEAQPAYRKWGIPWVKALGGWFAAFALMAGVGVFLSAVTLSTARRLATQRQGATSAGARTLRGLYRAVIAMGSVFYYVSLPLVFVSVLAVGGGLVYGFLAIGRIPVKLVVIIAALVLATLWALLRSLFVRISDEDPGERLDWAKAPRLRQLVDEVAAKVGTRTVDTVFLTPGTDLAVFERGGHFKTLAGKGERCLILGVGVLEGFPKAAFRSVLAHEFGHFSNKDTAGGGLALIARSSLLKMGYALAEGGAAAWYNPAWLFFRGFYAVFLRMSQGASRLQEVLADRMAIFTYGSAAFATGYGHVIRQSVRFDAVTQASLQEVIAEKKALANLYRFVPATSPSSTDLDKAYEEAINREPSPYDSHPASRDRLAWAEALAIQVPPCADDAEEVWSAFDHRDELERTMTALVRSNIAARHDVFIEPGVEAAPG